MSGVVSDQEKCDVLELFLQQLKEANVTANVDGYNTPHAFGNDKKQEILKKSLGYPTKIAESLSYRNFKKDETKTPRTKINRSIVEIGRRLDDIKKILDNNIKLQEESGVEDIMWKLSPERVNKIMKKLVYIGNRIKDLG